MSPFSVNFLKSGLDKLGKKQLSLLAIVRPPKSGLPEVNGLTGVDAEVCVQLVFQAKLFGTVLALVWLPCFVPLLTGLLLHHVPGSIETASSTGLVCADKKINANSRLTPQRGKNTSVPLTAKGPVK